MTAHIGSRTLSYYSVKYWHIYLSDLLSMLGNVTVSSTVTIQAPTLKPENFETNSKFLLQRKGLVKMRSQNELSFAQNELVGDVSDSVGPVSPIREPPPHPSCSGWCKPRSPTLSTANRYP